MEFLILGLWALSVARVSRLATVDKITEPLRAWVLDKRGRESSVTYLAYCPVCFSIWVAFASAPYVIVLNSWSWWLLPVVALAAAQITLYSTRLTDE